MSDGDAKDYGSSSLESSDGSENGNEYFPTNDSLLANIPPKHESFMMREDKLKRHPLQFQWVLWYLKADRNKDWQDCLKEVAMFNTIEDFWCLYNMLQTPSELGSGSDYYLFKEGIKPMWEDENNVKGGRWLVLLDKQKRSVDEYWLELLMAITGEQFEEYGDQICGIAINVRQRADKISIWTRDSCQDEANLHIGQIIKAKLNIPDSEPILYEVHKDAFLRAGSPAKPRIVLPLSDSL